MRTVPESEVEEAAREWLERLGWETANGPTIAPDGADAERGAYDEVVLMDRLRDALQRLNPKLPHEALEDAFRKVSRPEGPTLETGNRAFHRMFIDGVNIEYRTEDGEIRGTQAKIVDFDKAGNNDWLAVNQFRVEENKNSRRMDIILFVNGLPLGVIELKKPSDENATVWTAWQQLQTYKAEFPTLFSMNEVLIVSDGLEAHESAP